MPSPPSLTPRRRDALTALVAVVLLAGPVWIPALHLDDPTYRYERTGVVVDGSGVAFANESEVPPGTILSKEIPCTDYTSRVCAFERHLARNATVPTEIYSSSPGDRTDPFAVAPGRYEYVQIDGTVYETTTVANRSRVYVVANGTVYEKGEAPTGTSGSGDMYRNELALRPTPPAEALADVSRDPDAVAPPIRRAAENGVGVAHSDLDVPETPIRTDDGAYYRVYLADRRPPLVESAWIEMFLVVGGPVVGLSILFRLRRRIEITYVGAADDPHEGGL